MRTMRLVPAAGTEDGYISDNLDAVVATPRTMPRVQAPLAPAGGDYISDKLDEVVGEVMRVQKPSSSSERDRHPYDSRGRRPRSKRPLLFTLGLVVAVLYVQVAMLMFRGLWRNVPFVSSVCFCVSRVLQVN